MKLRLLPTLVFSLAAVAGSAQAVPPAGMANGMLVDSSGMTLYIFDRDAAGSGKSACNGPCATLWPPAMAGADAKTEGDFTVVTRDDGAKQWAYKGKPLYSWAKDAKPGDKTGDGFGGIWHIVAE